MFFHNVRHPAEMAEPEINAFLTHFAVKERTSASTQNQALSALLVLYRYVLGRQRGIPYAALRRLIPPGISGFILNASTSLFFLAGTPDQYLYNRFIVKGACMTIAGLNVAFFYGRVFAGLQRTGADAPPPGARVAGGLSLTAWIGVMSAERLLTFFRP
jgi:hypothetical protein